MKDYRKCFVDLQKGEGVEYDGMRILSSFQWLIKLYE